MIRIWPFGRKQGVEEQPISPEEESHERELDHLDWGIRLGTLERYERAAEMFRKVVEAHPDDAAGHYNLGLALDLAGQHAEARGAYDEALKIDAGLADARINLGLVLLDMDDHDEAIKALQTAVLTAPGDALAFYNLGCVYIAKKQWQEAVEEFQKAANADPKDARTRFDLAIALRKSGNSEAAEAHLRDFLALARGRYPKQQEYAMRVISEDYDSGETDAS